MPRGLQQAETPFDLQDMVQGALQLAVLAKRLREEAMRFKQEYSNAQLEHPLVLADYFKARESIAVKALKLRDAMVSQLVELASVVPLEREGYVNALNILYSLNPYDIDSVLMTVANDSFIELYISLVLSAMYSGTGTPPTPVFVPWPMLGTGQPR